MKSAHNKDMHGFSIQESRKFIEKCITLTLTMFINLSFRLSSLALVGWPLSSSIIGLISAAKKLKFDKLQQTEIESTVEAD